MIPFFTDLADYITAHQVPCFFKSVLGIDCPGCGMTRAFVALLRGDLVQSFCYHPALIPLILTLLLVPALLITKHPHSGKWIMWSFIAVAGITILQFLVKQFLLFHP